MFQHFDAVVRHRVQPGHGGAIFLSAAAHVAVLTALVRLPTPPIVEWTAEEVVEFLSLENHTPILEREPPPVAEARRSADPAEPAPVPEPVTPPPVEAPDELPPVEARLSMVVPEPVAPRLAGTSEGEGGGLTVDSIAVNPELTLPFIIDPGERFRLPRLRNRELIVAILTRLYPRRLANRGLPSAATLRLAIDERGIVDPNSVRVIAYDREEFAFIVMDVARRFRFTPARYRNENVPIIIDIPVQWVSSP